MASREQGDKKDYWQNELRSLGLEPKEDNELNDKKELQHLLIQSSDQCIKIIRQLMVKMEISIKKK
jgi:hypothetical protein